MKPIQLFLLMVFIYMPSGATAFAQQGKYNFSKIDSVINYAILDSAFPGAVVLVGLNNKVIYNKAFGNFTYEKNSPAVKTNTMYDLASVSKIIATTTAAMICVDRGLFKLDDKVSKFIPQFSSNGKENITIRNLLLHNSGLPAFKKYYLMYDNSEDVINDIYNSKLVYQTGSKTVYSDLGIITLGKIIEKVSREKLDSFTAKEIFSPIEMYNTMYNPPDSLKQNIAPTEIDNYWRNRLIWGTVHDETAELLNGVAGHAGLFSTAGDLANYLMMILNKGRFKDKIILSDTLIDLFTKRQTEQSSRGLGWDTKSPQGSSAGNYFSTSSFGHTGFTGTSIWVDPVKKLFVVFLTNRVYPSRSNNKIRKVRPMLHDAVYLSVFGNN